MAKYTKGGHTHNCNHFTGKKNPIKNCKKRVVREKQQPHKNKYANSPKEVTVYC